MADSSINMDDSNCTAPKDRECQFCHQLFTSSSLGRHLDLYIKGKNPKAPDGIHDIEEIKKIRGSITRRQAKSNTRMHSREAREGSAVSTTRNASISGHKSPGSDMGHHIRPGLRSNHGSRDGVLVRNSSMDEGAGLVSDRSHWREMGGRNNSLPSLKAESSQEIMRGAYGSPKVTRASRRISRDAHGTAKVNHSYAQQLREAEVEGRAAKLALREILGAVKAANMRIDQTISPFDYDPCSLDFPALTLHCLEAPATLHTLTPIPSPESWSLTAPDQQQYDALVRYFHNSFLQWRVKHSISIDPKPNDYSYPPAPSPAIPYDHVNSTLENMIKETAANELELKVRVHLQATFAHWQMFSAAHRNDLWRIELARSIGRKTTVIKQMKERTGALLQENENLREQVEQLSRCQQPKEFQMMPPNTIAISAKAMMVLGEWSLANGGIGLSLSDKDLDLTSMVDTAVTRWKKTVQQMRPPMAASMSAQRDVDVGMQNTLATTEHEQQKSTSEEGGVDLEMNDVQGEEDAEGETEDENARDTQDGDATSQYKYGGGQRRSAHRSIYTLPNESPNPASAVRTDLPGGRSTPGRHKPIDL